MATHGLAFFALSCCRSGDRGLRGAGSSGSSVTAVAAADVVGAAITASAGD